VYAAALGQAGWNETGTNEGERLVRRSPSLGRSGYGWIGQRKSDSGTLVTVTSPAASAANTASSEVRR
jgi:hypothetical protein